jgi:hypothetical protein
LKLPVAREPARTEVRRRYERNFGNWAVSRALASPTPSPLLELPLHPPTESAGLAAGKSIVEWVKSWEGQAGVVWTDRKWASLGKQTVPERLVLSAADDVAAFCGRLAHWRRVQDRIQIIANLKNNKSTSSFETTLARAAGSLEALAPDDFTRLTAVLAWLAAHPDHGLYVRQLPILGIDTKWVGSHRSLVERLHAAITGRIDLGLRRIPDLVRLRFLDPVLAPGGLEYIGAPVTDLGQLEIAPNRTFVFENLESVLAMPPVEGAVVIHGSGYAVDRLALIPWAASSRITYWGDLDSHGFGVLNRLRAQNLDVRTVLMDLETLDAFRDLWVPEPTPNRGTLQHLSSEESEVLRGLAERGDVRLEQERIPWQHSLAALLDGDG